MAYWPVRVRPPPFSSIQPHTKELSVYIYNVDFREDAVRIMCNREDGEPVSLFWHDRTGSYAEERRAAMDHIVTEVIEHDFSDFTVVFTVV